MQLHSAESWNSFIDHVCDRSEWSRLVSMRTQRDKVDASKPAAEFVENADDEQSKKLESGILNSASRAERMHYARRSTQVAMSYWFKNTQNVVNKFYSIQYNPMAKCLPAAAPSVETCPSNVISPDDVMQLWRNPFSPFCNQ